MLDSLREALEGAKLDYARPERLARAEKAAQRAKAKGIRHQVRRLVAVSAGDIVAAADTVPQPDEVVRALRAGAADGNPGRVVYVELEHLERLVAACSP